MAKRTKEAEAQELQMDALSLFIKGMERIREANSLLSGVANSNALSEHLDELGITAGRR